MTAPPPPALRATDFTSRSGLMWPPRALDLARILAAADGGVSPGRRRILDHGAGSGLVARLLAPGAEVVAWDPGRAAHVGRFFPVTAEEPEGPFQLVLSSWMEAGLDLRNDVAARAPRILSVFDEEGGCGVKGDLDYSGFGLIQAAAWSGPSFEDVEEALQRRGRGLTARARNRFVLWTLPDQAPEMRRRLADARAGPALPWEAELITLGVGPVPDLEP